MKDNVMINMLFSGLVMHANVEVIEATRYPLTESRVSAYAHAITARKTSVADSCVSMPLCAMKRATGQVPITKPRARRHIRVLTKIFQGDMAAASDIIPVTREQACDHTRGDICKRMPSALIKTQRKFV
jgi:hypothetical protein